MRIGFVVAALMGASTLAQVVAEGPRISPIYPPAEDIRRPDITIPIAKGPVGLIVYTANGRWLATESADGVIRMFETRPGAEGTGAFIRAFATWDDTDDPALRAAAKVRNQAGSVVAVSPDKTLEARPGPNNIIIVRDATTGGILATLRGHAGEIRSIAFSANGQKMASGSSDGTARTWTVPLPPIPAATLHNITAAIPARATATPARPRRILVVWRADAILHKGGVPAVNHAIELMSKRTGAFEADFTRDAEAFDPSVLSKYDAIVMNSTAHLILNDAQRRAYLDYVRAGGGVVGIHAAIDMFLTWPEGAQVIGATFGDHPWGPNGTWKVKLEQPNHPLLRAFDGKGFTIRDEFYVMGEPYSRGDRGVLVSVDLSDPATGAVNLVANPSRAKDRDFALAWIKTYHRGRVFYANFGHIAEPFERADILRFYMDGIQWVLGDLKTD